MPDQIPIPVALDTSSFKYPKFDSVDWSDKCESIKSYLESYVDTYLSDDVFVSFENQCLDSVLGEGKRQYYLRTLLIKEDFQLELYINIYASKTKSEGSLYKKVDSRRIVNFDTEADMLGEDIKNISVTFDSWLNGNDEATVFGEPFNLFSQRVFELGSDKDGMMVEVFDNAYILIRLSSTDTIREKGDFEILSIDDSVYSESEDNDFLGCGADEGINCLNNKSLEYFIVGNQLQLKFPAAPNQPQVSVTMGITFEVFP